MDLLLVGRLFSLGWSAYKSLDIALTSTTQDNLDSELQQYAAFHGLSSLGDVKDHINEPRICSLPDTMPIGTSVCKWPDGDITWDITADIKGLTRSQVQEGVTEAFSRWAQVSGIRPTFTPGNPKARILIHSRDIDGVRGLLAESELPDENVLCCRQWYDNSENWGMFNGPNRGKSFDFMRVATHELGHALGLNHIGAGNLLAPVYSQTVWTPQSGDIAEMVARYGPSSTVPLVDGLSPEEIAKLKVLLRKLDSK